MVSVRASFIHKSTCLLLQGMGLAHWHVSSPAHHILFPWMLFWYPFQHSDPKTNYLPGEAQRSKCLLIFWPQSQTLESPLDCKEIKPVNRKGNQSECSLEGLMLKLKFQCFGHLMRRTDLLEDPDLGKIKGRRRWGQQRMRWLAGITDPIDMSLSS